MADHGHGGGHGGGDHGHAKPKGGGGHGGGGGGGGGSLTLTLQNAVLLFFGLPLAVLGLGWMVANPEMVMVAFDAAVKIVFLIAFIFYRLAWTFPLVKQEDEPWLKERLITLFLRSPAWITALLLILYLWIRTAHTSWHPGPPGVFNGDISDHFPAAAVAAILLWMALNVVSWPVEWLWYRVTGIHWPKPHAAAH